MNWVLLKADHRTAPPKVETWEFSEAEADEASDALCEMEFNKADYEEVVLFGVDSVETLHYTHPRYFYTGEQIMENLRRSLHEQLTPIH